MPAAPPCAKRCLHPQEPLARDSWGFLAGKSSGLLAGRFLKVAGEWNLRVAGFLAGEVLGSLGVAELLAGGVSGSLEVAGLLRGEVSGSPGCWRVDCRGRRVAAGWTLGIAGLLAGGLSGSLDKSTRAIWLCTWEITWGMSESGVLFQDLASHTGCVSSSWTMSTRGRDLRQQGI